MTFLCGQQGSGWTLGSTGQGSGGDAIAYKNGYLATAGTATTAYVHINEDVTAAYVKVFIYDQGGNLVGQSGQMDCSTTGLKSAALTASVALTAQTYTLVVQPNSGYVNIARNAAGANFQNNSWYDDSGSTFSYASPPSTLPTPDVTDSGYEFIVWLDGTVGASVAVTSVSSGATFEDGETSITITGTGFGASQGNGTVKIAPTDDVDDASAVSQTVTAWSDTSITITAVRGSLAYNTAMYLFVTEDGGSSNASGYSVQFVLNPILLVRTWN